MKRILLPLMLFAATPAFAQTTADTGGDRRAEIHQAVEAEMGQLATKLGLDSAGSAALKATFAKYHTQMQPVRQDMWQTMKALRQELSSATPNGGRLSQLEDQLTSDRSKMQSIETARSAELRSQLTPVQYGQLVLSRRAFAREMHQHMRGHGHGHFGNNGGNGGGEPSAQ